MHIICTNASQQLTTKLVVWAPVKSVSRTCYRFTHRNLQFQIPNLGGGCPQSSTRQEAKEQFSLYVHDGYHNALPQITNFCFVVSFCCFVLLFRFVAFYSSVDSCPDGCVLEGFNNFINSHSSGYFGSLQQFRVTPTEVQLLADHPVEFVFLARVESRKYQVETTLY